MGESPLPPGSRPFPPPPLTMLLAIPVLAIWAMTAFSASLAAPDDRDLVELVAEVERSRESTDPEVLQAIADLGDRPAAEALIEIYNSQGSLYVRTNVLRLLPSFDANPKCGQLVLQQLLDVAVGAGEPELRDLALQSIGESEVLGRGFLEIIVNSNAANPVRVRALELHLTKAEPGDQAWYRSVYDSQRALELEAEEANRKRSKKKGKAAEELIVYPVPELVERTFEVLMPQMKKAELAKAIEKHRLAVRLMAMGEYARRDPKAASKLVEPLYKQVEERVEVRVQAAEIMAETGGKKIVKRFVSAGGKFATPEKLRMALAGLVAKINDGATNKKLRKGLDKGRSYQQRFQLAALRNAELKDLDESVLELLAKSDDVEVQRAAAEFLAKRSVKRAAPEIEKLLAKSEDARWGAEILDLLGMLHAGEADWIERLREYAESEAPEIRNGAIRHLGLRQDMGSLDLMLKGLRSGDWSTRLASLHALGELRNARAVGPIIERMQEETGRMNVEFAEVLYSLTGQPFRRSETRWLAWWKREGSNFEVISLAELEDSTRQRDLRRMKSSTTSKLFGIQIVSHRVIFIVDVSGSMEETMRRESKSAIAETRMSVARRELVQAISSLENGALYNLITFSTSVNTWLKDGMAAVQEASRAEAKKFVRGLRAGGGTNLFDALEVAFEDPNVDTIFVISDGEPSYGRVLDVHEIRDAVARWNRNRGIQINTIGIGTELSILEWLAEDSGGKSVLLF